MMATLPNDDFDLLHGVGVFLLADQNVVIEKLTEHELRRSSAEEIDGEQQ